MIDYRQGKLFEFNNSFFEKGPKFDYISLFQLNELALECRGEIFEHTQVCNEISCIISGEGTFYTDGVPTRVSAGDIHIISAGHRHKIVADSESYLRFVCMGFCLSDNAPESMLPLYNFYESAAGVFAADNGNVRCVTDMLINELYTKRPYSDDLIELMVRQLLIQVYRLAQSEKAAAPCRDEYGKNIGATVYRIIKYIDNNIYTVNRVRSIARELSFDECYVSHVFKNKMGITLQTYIRRKKIETAKVLLKYGNLTIGEVSNILNFDSTQSFSRAFKREMNCTPGEYKKTNTAT